MFGSCPLVLKIDNLFSYKNRFHFCAFWLRLPSYLETVEWAWHCPLNGANPFHRLDWLLRNTARLLKSWSDKSVGNIRIQLEVVKEVIHRLEMARDRRLLMDHE
jgi:hypothetical protein